MHLRPKPLASLFGNNVILLGPDEQEISLDEAMLLSLMAHRDEMRPTGQPQTPDQELRQAILLHDLFKVQELLNNPKLGLSSNTPDPESGRTALHEAASCESSCSTSKMIFKTLVDEYKADKTVRDKEGYTPVELLGHPHSFDKETVASDAYFFQMMNHYAVYFVNELNAKLFNDEEKLGTGTKKLQMVASTADMLQYIDDNPGLSQIGFIIPRPNCNKELLKYHSSPILFDRTTNVFVQLDSFGLCYLIPERAGATFIYSPIERMVSLKGCLEDSIILSYHILTQFPDFFRVCEEKRVSDTGILEPVDEQMKKEYFRLQMSAPTKEDKNRLELLHNKIMVSKQLDVLLTTNTRPLTTSRLTEWPVELAFFLERFDALYPLRTSDKLGHRKNHPILKKLLEDGAKRTPALSKPTLLANLIVDPKTDHDKKYDIAGKNFLKRHELWMKVPSHRHSILQGLFRTKLNSLPQDRFDSKKSSEKHEKEKADIVRKITDFTGTFRM